MAATTEVTAAHAEVVAIIRAIPDAALDWQPGGGDWSLRQIISHLAHANDFYLMIVEEACAGAFGAVRLDRYRELAGWQRMQATDAAVARCTTVPEALDRFEEAYGRLLTVLNGLTPVELDRPFVLYEPQPAAEPMTTTLRRRVVAMAASHLRDHQAQVAETLARWRAADQEQQRPRAPGA